MICFIFFYWVIYQSCGFNFLFFKPLILDLLKVEFHNFFLLLSINLF